MPQSDKRSLSERDICTKFITPALVAASWNIDTQIREEVGFTDGRIHVRGKIHKRGKQKRADHIIYYKPNIPVAIIEAKDNNHTVGAGMQQALGYADAKTLDIPFVFSSNGDAFLFHDKTVKSGNIETEIPLHAFPSPEQLLKKYKTFKGITDDIATVVAQDYYSDGSNRSPRYYQQIVFAALNDEIGSAFDPFDLICHIAYEQKPLTRKERAEQVKKRDYFTKYGDLARKVIAALLDKYADDGGLDFENPEIIRLDPLNRLGSPVEIIRAFGGKAAYDAAIHELTGHLYEAA